MRGIRDLLEAIPVDDPEIVTIEASGGSARRKVGGTVPHDLGGPGDDPYVRPNWYRYQDVNGWKDLGPKFVLQAWRDIVASGAGRDELIEAVLPTVEAVLGRLAASDRDGDGLPEHDGLPDQTYDTWPMRGPSAYCGSLWLGAVAAAEAMARCVGDEDASRRWRAWLDRGRAAFDRRLWRGDHYAYADNRIDQLHYLRYSEAEWKKSFLAPPKFANAGIEVKFPLGREEFVGKYPKAFGSQD